MYLEALCMTAQVPSASRLLRKIWPYVSTSVSYICIFYCFMMVCYFIIEKNIYVHWRHFNMNKCQKFYSIKLTGEGTSKMLQPVEEFEE